MSGQGMKVSDALQRILRIERDAVMFFEKIHRIAYEPIMRDLFEKLTIVKREHLKMLEEGMRGLGNDVLKTEPSAELEIIYPITELEKAECYVCGFMTRVDAIPDACPRCGASKYAFEKEITPKKIWEIAQKGSHRVLKLLDEVEKEAGAKTEHVVNGLRRLEQRLYDEALRELDGLK